MYVRVTTDANTNWVQTTAYTTPYYICDTMHVCLCVALDAKNIWSHKNLLRNNVFHLQCNVCVCACRKWRQQQLSTNNWLHSSLLQLIPHAVTFSKALSKLKAQSSKFERLFSMKHRKTDVQAVSFELWKSFRKCHSRWNGLYICNKMHVYVHVHVCVWVCLTWCQQRCQQQLKISAM